MRGNGGDGVVLERGGVIRAEGDNARQRLDAATGRYALLSAAGHVLLLQKTPAAGKRARVLMVGELISRSTVMELVSFMALNGWHGELHLEGPSGMRWLKIADGALKAAGSTVESERMGEVMVQSGLLSPDQLARCVLEVTPQRRFGEIAVQKGFVRREQLFEALRTQMQRVFQNALLEESGQYVVLQHEDGDPTANVPALLLHVPIQELLMGSVQRIDEMALFRQLVPSGDACPVLTPRAGHVSISESLRPLAALADGARSVLDIARELHADEYQTTKQVCQLVQLGVIEVKAQRVLDEAEALRVIGRFNQVLKKIFDTVARYGRKEDMHWTLDAWIRDTALSRYFEDCMRREGTLDALQVAQKLAKLGEPQPLDALQQALHELAAFAMLSAGGALPREAEQALSRVVGQQLTNLRRA